MQSAIVNDLGALHVDKKDYVRNLLLLTRFSKLTGMHTNYSLSIVGPNFGFPRRLYERLCH